MSSSILHDGDNKELRNIYRGRYCVISYQDIVISSEHIPTNQVLVLTAPNNACHSPL